MTWKCVKQEPNNNKTCTKKNPDKTQINQTNKQKVPTSKPIKTSPKKKDLY